jgi:aspartyl-tRNA synthetase
MTDYFTLTSFCIAAVATYGDAANTVYLDPSWEVWRDLQTGAACGFKESEGHALAWGRPLCPDSMLKGVVDRFLHYLRKERKLKPIFACIDETTEQILAGKDYDWRSLSVAAEERIDPTVHNPNSQTSKSNLAKKIKQAKNAGVKAVSCPSLPDEKVRKAIDVRMEDWRATREGKQIHTTDLLPWDDPEHRRYFYAQDKQGKVSEHLHSCFVALR